MIIINIIVITVTDLSSNKSFHFVTAIRPKCFCLVAAAVVLSRRSEEIVPFATQRTQFESLKA